MRTTLEIDDDVLAAARGLSQQRRQSIGKVISDLARKGLAPRSMTMKTRNGVPLLPMNRKSKPVTMKLVNELRDAETDA